MAKRSNTPEKRQGFDATMADVTESMPRHKRIISRIIHTPLVYTASDFISRWFMRPNALLFGAVTSFSLTLAAYLLSKNLGYSLSGSESIVTFVIGWCVGFLFDSFKPNTKK